MSSKKKKLQVVLDRTSLTKSKRSNKKFVKNLDRELESTSPSQFNVNFDENAEHFDDLIFNRTENEKINSRSMMVKDSGTSTMIEEGNSRSVKTPRTMQKRYVSVTFV